MSIPPREQKGPGTTEAPTSIAKSPFFTFLKSFRNKHKNWPELKLAVEGARKWRTLADEQKRKFEIRTYLKKHRKRKANLEEQEKQNVDKSKQEVRLKSPSNGIVNELRKSLDTIKSVDPKKSMEKIKSVENKKSVEKRKRSVSPNKEEKKKLKSPPPENGNKVTKKKQSRAGNLINLIKKSVRLGDDKQEATSKLKSLSSSNKNIKRTRSNVKVNKKQQQKKRKSSSSIDSNSSVSKSRSKSRSKSSLSRSRSRSESKSTSKTKSKTRSKTKSNTRSKTGTKTRSKTRSKTKSLSRGKTMSTSKSPLGKPRQSFSSSVSSSNTTTIRSTTQLFKSKPRKSRVPSRSSQKSQKSQKRRSLSSRASRTRRISRVKRKSSKSKVKRLRDNRKKTKGRFTTATRIRKKLKKPDDLNNNRLISIKSEKVLRRLEARSKSPRQKKRIRRILQDFVGNTDKRKKPKKGRK